MKQKRNLLPLKKQFQRRKNKCHSNYFKSG
jgi:hypothetical protein